jgi:hypothetical protein
MTDMVCAWCDVYARVERAQYDDEGRPFIIWSACAYCGRSELRLGKRGRQTPIPEEEVDDRPDGRPF